MSTSYYISLQMVSIATILVSLYISASYVAVLYKTSKEIEKYPSRRDDPRVIMMRVKRVSFITVLNLVFVPILLYFLAPSSPDAHSLKELILNIGLVPGRYINGSIDLWSYFTDIFKCVWLICLLFVGPLFDSILFYTFVKGQDFFEDIRGDFFTIWGMRNYVFAPITEEIVYTSMLLNTYLVLSPSSGSLSYKVLLWQPPIFFGLAHIHHAHEARQIGIQTMPSIILNASFQALYTTLFGSLTNYVFLKTGGNLWACIALHSFCNIMGVPDGSKIVTHYKYTDTPKEGSTLARFINIWKKIYILLLPMGILFFKDQLKLLVDNKLHKIHI